MATTPFGDIPRIPQRKGKFCIHYLHQNRCDLPSIAKKTDKIKALRRKWRLVTKAEVSGYHQTITKTATLSPNIFTFLTSSLSYYAISFSLAVYPLLWILWSSLLLDPLLLSGRVDFCPSSGCADVNT
jgi:hypothetical protein